MKGEAQSPKSWIGLQIVQRQGLLLSLGLVAFFKSNLILKILFDFSHFPFSNLVTGIFYKLPVQAQPVTGSGATILGPSSNLYGLWKLVNGALVFSPLRWREYLHPIGLLWRLSVKTEGKCLECCLDQSKHNLSHHWRFVLKTSFWHVWKCTHLCGSSWPQRNPVRTPTCVPSRNIV